MMLQNMYSVGAGIVMVINGILCRLGSITKMKKYISILSIIILLLLSSTPTYAHSGRTDSSGGHNCYVGACAGTYHYHNGGSAPAPYIPPKTIASPKPTPKPTPTPVASPTPT